ncbi:putative Polysaccharide deacetylase [Pseudorhizobium banfieldiae]|uniref:Chitooligosaccharide deacetylase n=1 Tax=Pseudorhizobium banfieldiae TaxID=1125847 RepID=L0NBZ3_9HYPH|nr:polysaccharide deacetylase family protein [Pseudorhizobium banfieldiae]CAD6601913.1 polysaccharide deacetylase [arsenite-oxidising bacterium NT-25]CCF18316.1 putative Polysaccharide deacetylase [Pseudorhizobium banfieldiae]
MEAREGSSKEIEVYLSVDVEPDCPPYLWTWRGIEEGMPKLIDLFTEEKVLATFFVTGDTASRYPQMVECLVENGHEIGCHGFSHHPFRTFDEERAMFEVAYTNSLLRKFAPVTSFRAPYLQLPERFLPLLAADGIRTDSSRAKYKFCDKPNTSAPTVQRLPVSATSSILRLPSFVRDPLLRWLRSPVVLFVHPWEFVDLTRHPIRVDCRFRTGDPALRDLRDVIRVLRDAGAAFRLVQDFREAKGN